MRIAHCLNHTRQANGHVAVAVDLACEQAKSHEVAVVSGSGDFDDALRSAGVKIFRISDVSGAARPFRMPYEMFRALWSFRADVVNAHMPAAALAARVTRPLLRFKLVTTVHNAFDRQSRFMGVGDRVIAVSEAVRCQMEDGGIAAGKLHTVTNGTIGGARRPHRPARAVPLMQPAIVTVCGMHDRKGVGDLIAAFDEVAKMHSAPHLYLVGEGPERAKYEAQASGLTCGDRIHFLGFMEDPREVLAGAAVFVLASHRDPCPLVISEARQMGNAIIATSVDGIPSALAHGKRGMLVPPGDPKRLAAAIADLLGDAALRGRYAAAATEQLDDISVAVMSARTVRVYEDALAPGGQRRPQNDPAQARDDEAALAPGSGAL